MRAVNWALVNAAVSIVLLIISLLLFGQAVWIRAKARDLEPAAVLHVQPAEGLLYEYRVSDRDVGDSACTPARLGVTRDAPVPANCYPFDTIDENGRLRYVATGLRYDF
jgi:hypothetical protein